MPQNGYVSNKRFEDGIEHIGKRLDDHESDTTELKKDVAAIRSKVQESSEALARIEGTLAAGKK